MEVVQGTPGGTGSAVNLNQTWLLTTANSGGGRRYQEHFTVQLPTSGVAEDLLLAEATNLRLKALPYGYDALDGGAPEPAQVSRTGDHQGLLIKLPLARLISSIRFRSGVSPAGKTTQLFRTDGDVIADGAVASWVNGPTATKHGGGKASKMTKGGGSVGAAQVTVDHATDSILVQEDTPEGLSAAELLTGGELDVLDSRIVVRLLGSSGFAGLGVADLTQVNISAGPENLRLGVRLPALDAEVSFLPLQFEANTQVNAGSELRAQLTDLLQRLKGQLEEEGPGPVPVLPDPLSFDLVVESDAPCRFTISQFEIDYQLARQSFPDGAPKQVLRFPKDQLTRRQISLQVPAGVTVTSATLTLAGDGVAGAEGASGTLTPDHLSATLNAAGTSGLRVDGTHQWASPITLTEPILSGGWDLLLAGLAADTQLRLELVADQNGQPGGNVLARAEATLPKPKRQQLLHFRLSEPVLLHAGSYWLTLICAEGAAVWYLQAAAGQRVLQLRERRWEGVNSVTDQSAVAVPVPAGGEQAAERRFPEITLGGQALVLLSSDGDWVYDLGTAIAGAPLAGSGLVSMELGILSASARPVTLYPPLLQFEI